MYGALHSSRPLPSADALLAVGRAFTPRIEGIGPATVLLDLRGLGRVWPDVEGLGRAVLDAAVARGIEAHVSLAWSRIVARLAARARPGLTVVLPGQEAATLAPWPLELLDLAPEQHELLQRWGLRTLGDVAALPAAELAERLGPAGPRLRRLARGLDDAPLVPTPPPESFECTLDLDWPVDGLEPLAFLMGRVLETLCRSLAERGRRAAAMTLALRLVDGSRHERTLRPAAPSREARTWRTLLLLDLESHPPCDAIQSLTVRAQPVAARAVQFSLLDPAQPSPERLAEMLGRLREWTEAGRAGSPVLLDTHRPGAFAVESFAPPALVRAGEGPPHPRLALRPYRPPLPADVVVRDGGPAFVAAAGVRGPVVDRAGPWRSSGDWWDVAWSREEWDVALGAERRLYRIFRDRLGEGWFVEGELD